MRLAIVLALLAVLFAASLLVSIRENERVARELEAKANQQNQENLNVLAGWSEQVLQEHARQLAAPFLWDVETLDGVEEGSPEFNKIQGRMRQFVYGSNREPAVPSQPVGPLESILIIDQDHRIVVASDPLQIDKRFTDPEEVAALEKAWELPQIKEVPSGSDSEPVAVISVPVPNRNLETIGIVRLRYVGGTLTDLPSMPTIETLEPKQDLVGPLLAGLIAVLGVGFGGLATWQVISLTRRMEAMAQGVRLGGAKRGPGGEALSMIEERLEKLSDSVRRDDLLVESLTEALREGVILLDPSGELVTANRQARLLLESPARGVELSADLFRELIESNEELGLVVDEGLRHRQAVRERALPIDLPDGSSISAQVTTYVLHDGGQAAGILLVLKDRASIENLEHSLRQADKLQPIIRLTGSVAHEVRNPLNAIEIHLTNLNRKLSKLAEADPGAQDRLLVIRQEINRLKQILDEWLGLTGPEERSPANAHVAEVVDSVARLLRVEARDHGIELIVEVEGDPGQVTMSTAHLRQVLLNLSLNAIQSMSEGKGRGQLILRARPLPGGAELHVEDTGNGIPEHVRDQIFEYHFTTRDEGSGLGLPICKRLVEESEGTLEFESEVGSGTTFSITLPAHATLSQRRADVVQNAL